MWSSCLESAADCAPTGCCLLRLQNGGEVIEMLGLKGPRVLQATERRTKGEGRFFTPYLYTSPLGVRWPTLSQHLTPRFRDTWRSTWLTFILINILRQPPQQPQRRQYPQHRRLCDIVNRTQGQIVSTLPYNSCQVNSLFATPPIKEQLQILFPFIFIHFRYDGSLINRNGQEEDSHF